MRSILISLTFCAAIAACSQSRRIAQTAPQPVVNTSSIASLIGEAQQVFINDTALADAHVGISIYDPVANRYLYNYQGDKYFVPASNTKLFTCYAAMKYLGDSLVGARYRLADKTLTIIPTADPTFLLNEFSYQPLWELIRNQGKIVRIFGMQRVSRYGSGWGWDDYEANYMAERSAFPVFGNMLSIRRTDTNSKNDTLIRNLYGNDSLYIEPAFFEPALKHAFWRSKNVVFKREERQNIFDAEPGDQKFDEKQIPFVTEADTSDGVTAVHILQSMLQKPLFQILHNIPPYVPELYTALHSQPTDSLLKPMMHRSDNFFAEQSLLMVSNEKLGYMNDEAIIDTLLKTDLKDLPQKPVWVDGSGLSRYNMFTPQDMVAVLLKMKNEFGLERIRNILPKGNTGTLTNYYQQIGPAIFAKTGSLSGQVALSGFLTCKSGKLLIFSVMINNYTSSGRAVRRAMEKFVMQVWEKN